MEKVLKAFQEWWLKKSVPDTYGGTENRYSPSSLAMTDRKGAARLAFEAGYNMAMNEKIKAK